jgi:hypothetical protein
MAPDNFFTLVDLPTSVAHETHRLASCFNLAQSISRASGQTSHGANKVSVETARGERARPNQQ